MNKKELRKKFQLILSSLSSGRKEEASQKALEKLESLSRSCSLVASFSPIDDELNLWPFNQIMAQKGRLLLPRVSGKDLHFYPVKSIDELTPSSWGILEPHALGSPCKVDSIDLVLVPALGFDASNQRLGRGKGYYDTFISTHRPKKTIGVGFKEQISSSPLPVELHDQTLDDVLLF